LRTQESKLAYYAETQAAHAAHNVVALLAGRALKDYGLNTFRVAFVTLGPRGGATQIGWLVFGVRRQSPSCLMTRTEDVQASITSMIKSKNLFVSMFRSAVGYKD
jgi:NADH dehydrogenase FAD-containing subunit